MQLNTATPETSKLAFWAIFALLFTGIVLSVISALDICYEHCAAASHEYRLLGFHFSTIGLFFFVLLRSSTFSLPNPRFSVF